MKEMIWHGMNYVGFVETVAKKCNELNHTEREEVILCRYDCGAIIPKKISEITQGACFDCRSDLSYDVVPRDPKANPVINRQELATLPVREKWEFNNDHTPSLAQVQKNLESAVSSVKQ